MLNLIGYLEHERLIIIFIILNNQIKLFIFVLTYLTRIINELGLS